MRRHTRGTVVGAACALVLAATTACASGSDQPDPTASAARGDGGARVVERVDVDGDGERDAVRYRVLKGDRVRIGVGAGGGSPVRTVLDTSLWPGPGGEWYGAAEVDGRAGAELLVGTTHGAHTPMFTVLTLRSGRLVVQPDPATGQREWWVDAFYNGFVGWSRVAGDPTRMVRREVFRVGDGHVWRGQVQSFRWDAGRWLHDDRHDLRIRGDEKAARVAGWHVAGLPQWPS